jgi:CheY-like chemotaxis protein
VSTHLSRVRILVADDQVDVARTLCSALRRHGALLTFVPDAEQAYTRVDAEPYDLLMVCAQALAHGMPLCCEKHEDEFKAEFLRVLNDCIVEERDAAEAEGGADDDMPPQMH